jgi:hypothetical protein
MLLHRECFVCQQLGGRVKILLSFGSDGNQPKACRWVLSFSCCEARLSTCAYGGVPGLVVAKIVTLQILKAKVTAER